MNKKQRLVLAIFVPIIILFITLIIANSVGYTAITRTLSEGNFLRKYGGMYHEGNPFDWKRTWYIWFLSLTFCCIFEYRLFGDKKQMLIESIYNSNY
jgi:hypothetical protein